MDGANSQGEGDRAAADERSAIVFVHGNPTWSFTWRHLIAALRGGHRCIAMDHLGFGLSDKPEHVLTPSDRTAHLGQLLDHLAVQKVTLVVEDWGGPIGLAWAMENAPRIERVVVLNSWCWSVAGDPHFERFSAFMGGRFGRFLIKTFNAFARFVLPKAVGHRLPRQVHQHYLAPFPTRQSRNACANFPKQIISESDWLSAVWSQRTKLTGVPVLLYWGRRDIAFRDDELKRWTEAFPHAEVHTDDRAGHCPQESAPERLLPLLQGFLQDPAQEGPRLMP